MNQKADVVLFNPPFYRFLGSHNDKMPLSLTYLSSYLTRSKIPHLVYNADYTGASMFLSLRWMFDHYDTFLDAVDGKGSLYGEVTEKIISINPGIVVIMGGDPLVPTTEWGNAFIAAAFSRILRKYKIFTIGIGPFFTLDSEKFLSAFDCLLRGEPSDKLINIIKTRSKGPTSFSKMDLNIKPDLDHLYPSNQKRNIAMTSLGCPYKCTFCLSGRLYSHVKQPIRYIEEKIVAEDLKSRKEKEIYLMDLNFSSGSIERLKKLDREFDKIHLSKEFTIDSRVDCLDEEKVRWLKQLNVRRVKIGVESIDSKTLGSYNKQTNIHQIENAISLLKEYNIKVIFYLIIGPETNNDNYHFTYKFIKQWEPDYIIPNILAYDLKTDYKYDTEISPIKLKEFGVPVDLFYKFLELQTKLNPTVGKIID